MPLVSLDQKSNRVQFGAFEVDNKILFEFFNKLSAADRDEQLHKALYIGVLALMEDRLSSFLSRTANELGTELESLKLIFDMKKELFYRSAVKGVLAEDDIADFLSEFFDRQKIADRIELTGDRAGTIRRTRQAILSAIWPATAAGGSRSSASSTRAFAWGTSRPRTSSPKRRIPPGANFWKRRLIATVKPESSFSTPRSSTTASSPPSRI